MIYEWSPSNYKTSTIWYMGMDLYHPGNYAAYSGIRMSKNYQCFESRLKVDNHIPNERYRVTSLEQLRLAECSGE